MNTNRDIIQRLHSIYSKGVQSDDSRLTDRHCFAALTTGRATLLRQRFNKNQTISDWTYQTIPCIELIKAPIHECPCVPTNKCIILRSKHKIPVPITGISKSLIRSVTSLDGSIRFDESTFENEKYASGHKYTAKKPSYYIRNQYIYISILTLLKAIPVTGIFFDPVAHKTFPSICGPCVDCECQSILDMDFPIDPDLIDALLKISYQELIVLMKQIREDKWNNSSDDTSATGAMIHQPQDNGQQVE